MTFAVRMPSTHSSAVVCMAVYIMLAAARLPLHSSLADVFNSARAEYNLRILGPLMAHIWAVLILMSRVWLGHHTAPQVVAGAVFGGLFGLISFGAYVGGLDRIGWALEEQWRATH